jgi:hypothetical protein
VRAVLVLVLGAGLGAAACGPDDGSDLPPLEPTFASLDANVFFPRCTAPCHSGGEDFAAGGLDLEPDARLALLDVEAASNKCGDSGLTLLVAGDPEASLAYLKIVTKSEDTEPPCGDPMPSGSTRPPLTGAQIEALRAWIEAGAAGD